MAWPFSRSRGATVKPNVASPSIVFAHAGGHYNPTMFPGLKETWNSVGPGGGWTWGAGPKWFVPWSRGPEVAVELGRQGDFPDGGDGSPQPGDLGFPHASRWPGYPNGWEPPFFEAGNGAPGPYGGFTGGGLLSERVSTVFTCVDLISRTISSMDLSVTKNSAPVVAPAWCENPEPLLYTSMVDAMKCVINSMLMRGRALILAIARYGDGSVARWCVLNPDMVTIDSSAGLPTYWIGDVEIPRSEILHLRYQCWPGDAYGVGPLEAVWRNLRSADALERWGTALAVNGGIPTAVLSSAAKLTKDQALELKASWAEAAQSRGIYPVILSAGLTYTPLNLKPADIGLLDLRKFDESRIAAAFGCPLWLVGLPVQDTSLTYTTVAGTFDYFWRATLKALAYNITSGLSGWALPRGQWLRVDSESLTKPGLLERAQAYSNLIKSGVIAAEEARIFENLAPKPGDLPTVQNGDLENSMQTLAVSTEGGV